MKRIIAFLLFIAVTFTIISPSMLHVAADEITDIVAGEQETVAKTPEKTEKITTAEVDGIVVEVSGDALPKDAEVVADTSPDEKTEALSDIIAGESDGEDNAFSLDISLESEGVTAQPEEDSVRVSLSGINLDDCDTVTVYHVMDDVSSIAKRLESENGFQTYTLDGEAAAHFDKEIAAFTEAVKLAETEETFDENTICVEDISADNGLTVDFNSGVVSFDTDSFSTYYVLPGNTTQGETDSDFITVKNNNTYFVAQGTTIEFKIPSDAKSTATWTPKANSNALNLTKKSSEDEYSVYVPKSAQIGATTKIDVSYTGSDNKKKNFTITLTVKSIQDIVKETLNEKTNQNYRVILSCLVDPDNKIPGEPGLVSDRKYYLFDGQKNTTLASIVSNGTVDTSKYFAYKYFFTKRPNLIVKDDIVNDVNFIQDASGTNTMGVADASGRNTKKVLKLNDSQWGTVLGKFASSGKIKASDGTTVTSKNKGDYMLIPYVVKLQTSNGFSWNIDCYIAPKSDLVTLSYNYNFPNGLSSAKSNKTTKVLPESTAGVKQFTTKVTSKLSVDSWYKFADNQGNEFWYVFKGWKTGKTNGTLYNPDSDITVKSNTVLYAQWVPFYKYVLKFNLNGGTGTNTTLTSNGELNNQDGWTTKSSYTFSWKTDNPTRKGYKFDGWSTEKNGDLVVAPNSKKYKISGNSGKTKTVTLYAKWTPITYEISYNLDGGSASGNPTSYTIETNTITLKNPTRDGYEFLGWTGSNGKIPQKDVSIKKGSTGNKSYTANWKPLYKYNLNFYKNAGVGDDKVTGLPENQSAGWLGANEQTFKWTTEPERTGYVFAGWSRTSTGENVFVKPGTKEITLTGKEASTVTQDLYAIWKPGLGQIKITTAGLDPRDKDQTFIFVVSGTSDLGEKIELRIPIKGDGTAIVTDVPFGTYTVHCESDWSWRYKWRYKSSDDVIVEVKEMNKTYNVDFIQKRTDARWLSGCAYRKNEFEEKGNG